MKEKSINIRGEQIKEILEGIMFVGLICIVCVLPGASRNFSRLLYGELKKKFIPKAEDDKYLEYRNAFYYLRKHGLIEQEYKNSQLYISLTKEGRERAKKYRIDDLKIKKPRKWDNKWRVLIFDIADRHKIKREALRGKLKDWNLYQLQKSVWVCPYDMHKEIEFLRQFFGLNKAEMVIITASNIENDSRLKKYFKLKGK